MTSLTPLALWHAFGPIVMMTAASILALDANWMVACLRRGAQAPPPVFKAPIAIEGRWRQVISEPRVHLNRRWEAWRADELAKSS
jgi:hypothetical protein